MSTHTKPSRRFAAVVLAAGAPGKGRPGQLTPYLGHSLVEHVARIALGSGASEVVVVAGDGADEIRARLARLPVRVVENRRWREGISSSIRTGISSLRSGPEAAVICLCDQPKVTSSHLRALGERATAPDGPSIAASFYDGVTGAPAAFRGSLFERLLRLPEGSGARHLIREADVPIETIPFDEANAEVPVPEAGPRPVRPRRQAFISRFFGSSLEARAPPRRPNLSVV